MSRTKIVATIGPITCTPDALRRLKEVGMDVARLNGSHNNLDWHKETIQTIHAILPDTPILLDIPGRKIRTIQLETEPSFAAGDTIILTTDQSHNGSKKVPVNNESLHEYLKEGHVILADDGTLRFVVMAVEGRDIICRAETPGTLRSRKGINVPFVNMKGDLVTDRDREMLKFAEENSVDYIGISFVESAAHVEAVREVINGDFPQIVSKVENQGGLDNLEEVVGATDAIMIDRGDLSVETNLENLSLFQKRILDAGQAGGKPVIVATEMLHSMIENSFPTKAEVSDITNAVLDGCAATMLSGETAVGAHPIEAVSLMRRVADASASHLQDKLSGQGEAKSKSVEIPRAIDDAISLICRNLPIDKIVAITKSGYAARMLSTQQMKQPILATSNDASAARSFNLFAGVKGVFVDVSFSKDTTDHIPQCLEALWRQGELKSSDLILVTAVAYPKSGNRMNLIQTHNVSDLMETLNWKS